MAGREREPGPGAGPERAVPVRSVLLNRDSPDVESRRQRRRHRMQQVRFKDLVEGGVEQAQSPPQPPTADPNTPRASPPPRFGPEPAAPCASATLHSWTWAQPCAPVQSRSLSQLQPLSQLQSPSQPQGQSLPQPQLQPQTLPHSLLQPQPLLHPSKTHSSAAIQTSPSLQKPFVPCCARSGGAQEAAGASDGPGLLWAPGASCVPLPGAAGCSTAACTPTMRRGSPSTERCPQAPSCARPRGATPRPASVPCGRPPAALQRLVRSDSERSLRHLQRPRATPDAGARRPCHTAQGSPHQDPPRCSSPWRVPGCSLLPPRQGSLLPAPGSAATPRPTQPGLTARQAQTLRHVQDLLQLVATANGQAAPPGDEHAQTPQEQGPAGPGERGDLHTQLQSLEGVLETSQQTIRVLLDVIQDLEKKEAQRDGRLLYHTGQDITNCGTCRDCACIIYSVEHDFRQQEGRFQRVLSSMERDGSQGSPPGAPSPPEPSPVSRLPAKLECKKSRRKCFWFL
ncbi:uncharacterized protein ACNFOS_002039 [Eudromia elegans]